MSLGHGRGERLIVCEGVGSVTFGVALPDTAAADSITTSVRTVNIFFICFS